MNDEGPDDLPSDVEVVQKINPIRLIQMNLEAFHMATTRKRKALAVASLYVCLSGLRGLDSEFQGAWDKILGGHFMDYAANPRLRIHLNLTDIWAALEALQGLMERHNMGFQALMDDPLQVGTRQVLDRIQGLRKDLLRRPAPEVEE